MQQLQLEIVSLKKEIEDRDETLGDKEKRILELKKRNQELEKFKFVLDYTIKVTFSSEHQFLYPR
jgi:hypothetical protein